MHISVWDAVTPTRNILFIFLVVGVFLLVSYTMTNPLYAAGNNNDPLPNLLVIVADDLGYSDLGAFGSEIATPTLDKLAMSGVRLYDFHSAPTCSPTRAAFLSGTDPHIAGLGSMAEVLAENQRGQPGYEGYLNDRVVSVARLLQQAGYYTTMTGKWHLGLEQSQSPAARGFDRSFVLLQGGAGHFEDSGLFASDPKAIYRKDDALTEWPTGRYSSDFYTEKLIDFLRQKHSSKPFFAYLAFTAPHWPLQAPDDLIKKYQGRYLAGWDILREQRLEGLVKAGFPVGKADYIAPPDYRPWEALSQEDRNIEARKMEVYAAMVESIDINIAKLLDYLSAHDQLKNTVVFFFSDNGAEGMRWENTTMLDGWIHRFDNSLENIGRPGSYVTYGPGWAHASTAPWKFYKGHTSEGGTRVPAFIWRAGMDAAGEIAQARATVMDIVPTLLDLAKVDYPNNIRGRSLFPLFKDANVEIHTESSVHGTELFGRRAIRQGNWKLYWSPPPFGNGAWQLYNLKSDPGEVQDLSVAHPDIVSQLKRQWRSYESEVGVIMPQNTSSSVEQ